MEANRGVIKLYEIRLECLCCSASRLLGTIEAASRQDAREKASEKWPDARYKEIMSYPIQGQEYRSSVPPVRQEVS